jgi:hypothetical protein
MHASSVSQEVCRRRLSAKDCVQFQDGAMWNLWMIKYCIQGFPLGAFPVIIFPKVRREYFIVCTISVINRFANYT